MKLPKIFHHRSDKWSIYTKIASVTFIAAVLLLVCIYLLDASNTPSKIGIVDKGNSRDWLEYTVVYFGTIMASFIGFIGAIMAVSLTLEKQNEFRKEDSRKSVLPLAKVSKAHPAYEEPYPFPSIIDVAKKDQTILLLPIAIENVGQREMYDIYIGGVCCGKERGNSYHSVLPILYKGDQYSECFVSSIKNSGEKAIDISLKIYFKDCYDNCYYQELSGTGFGNEKTSYKIIDFKIKSAPILVPTNQPPSNIRK